MDTFFLDIVIRQLQPSIAGIILEVQDFEDYKTRTHKQLADYYGKFCTVVTSDRLEKPASQYISGYFLGIFEEIRNILSELEYLFRADINLQPVVISIYIVDLRDNIDKLDNYFGENFNMYWPENTTDESCYGVNSFNQTVYEQHLDDEDRYVFDFFRNNFQHGLGTNDWIENPYSDLVRLINEIEGFKVY